MIPRNNATDTMTCAPRIEIRGIYIYIYISNRGALYVHVIRYDAGRIMSTWKNLCSGRLGSKVTSGIMGARGFNGIYLSLSFSLVREKPFWYIAGSVTRLYRSCSIRDTRDDDYRREGGGERNRQAIADAARVTKRRRTEKCRKKKGREGKERNGAYGMKGDEGRGGRKMCGRGNKEKRSKRVVDSWPRAVRGYDRRDERKRERGWELNGAGS